MMHNKQSLEVVLVNSHFASDVNSLLRIKWGKLDVFFNVVAFDIHFKQIISDQFLRNKFKSLEEITDIKNFSSFVQW